MVDWTEKYRPSTLEEVRGNDKAVDKLREWAETWDDHREAVVLHGRPGVGKTSAAHALAEDLGWDVMEMNASDDRTRDVVDRVAGEASKSATLTGTNRRLLILDEADNFHTGADRGGAAAVTDVVKNADQPIVLVANEYYDMTDGLRNATRSIEFGTVTTRSIVPALRNICRKEGVEFEEDALRAIAERTSGDLRSAVNDLQAIAEGRDRITEADVATGERDTTVGIFDFLDDLIKESGPEDALKTAYDVDETPDDLIQWIEENVPKDYRGAELADAYGHLSTADRWLGRVLATQNYDYWRYATDAMAAGVAASRREEKGGWTRYGAPSMWSKLGRSRGRRNTRDAIARRIAEREGCSLGTARRRILPFLGAMIHHCKPRELTVAVAAAYELDAADLSFVTGSGEDTNKVQDIVEEARERREEAAVEASGGAFASGHPESRAADDAADDAAEGDGEPEAGGTGTLADHVDGDDGTTGAADGADAGESGAGAGESDGEARDTAAEPEDAESEPESDEDQSGLDEFV